MQSGDHVVIEWTAAGTHTGPLAVSNGQTIAATGRRALENGVLIAQVRNERIVRETTYWNLFSVLEQLGALSDAQSGFAAAT